MSNVSENKMEIERNKEYIKKTVQRKLNSFQEMKTANFSWGASLIIFFVLLFNGFSLIDKTINIGVLIFSAIYLIEGIIQYTVAKKIRKEIIQFNSIKDSTRKIGFVLILFVFTGNIFAAITGFTLIKKDKTIEYTVSIYTILVSVSIILISALNLFKEYVSDTFVFGMVILLIITMFYIIAMVMISKYVNGKNIDKKLIPVALVLIVTTVTGNVFALLLAMIIISKYRHKDKETSIEWIDVLTRLFRNNMSVIGMFVVVLLLSLSICSYLTFDYSIAIENNYSAILIKPCLMYPFGTDNYGRCEFTRIVFGARISLVIGVVVTIIPMVFGGLLGAMSGYYGGKFDNVVMRFMDILYAVPEILLAIAIVASFGASTFNLVIALSIGSIAGYARTVRATVMSISGAEFVEAAKACGVRDHMIILKHIIPNSLAPIIVRGTMGIGTAVLSTSSLSYLGLGVEPHIPEWGNVLKIGSSYLEEAPYLAIFPGLAIILIVLAFNFFGDGLRDALDPKLK